jgi:transposase
VHFTVVDGVNVCRDCEQSQAALHQAQARIAKLEAELGALHELLEEKTRTVELLADDIKRYRYAYNVGQPHSPERVPKDQLQLAFERLLETLPAANDVTDASSSGVSGSGDGGSRDGGNASEPSSATGGNTSAAPPPPPPSRNGKRNSQPRTGHGRRNPDLSNLSVETARIDPPEVIANPERFERIGEEISSRVGFRPASYVRLVLILTKWKPIAVPETAPEASSSQVTAEDTDPTPAPSQATTIHRAPLPPSLLPRVMADASAIANVIVSKYDDVLPLHRQERISARHGFSLPRSTQCGWLAVAFSLLYRIVLAMFDEAKAQAFCIATDATGAPVQKSGGCRRWHVFTFIADNGHIVFRWVNEHSGDAIKSLLSGFRGHLLSDAASIYEVLYRELGIVPVFCWAHVRRGFWRALPTDKDLATEAIAIIAKLFELERESWLIAMPERTQWRAARARPLLDLFDAWVTLHKDRQDVGEPLLKAIGYYLNQRDGLRRFLDDGRLRIHNNGAEGQLRNLAQGRDNWRYFVNRTGLNWYTTFRSLIASCHLHGINPQTYLEEVLRLAPHWPATQMLRLSPKYWPQTRAALTAQQLDILRSPWQHSAVADSPPADARAGTTAAALARAA